MKAALKKTPAGFVPCCEEGQKMFEKCELGALIMGELNRNRNPDNHRRFFKLLGETFAIQDQFDNEELWRKQMLLMAGHFEMVIVQKPEWWVRAMKYLEKYLGGPQKNSLIKKIDDALGVSFQVKSMAFDAIDEVEFRELFKRAVNGFIQNYAPLMDDKTFLRILDFD